MNTRSTASSASDSLIIYKMKLHLVILGCVLCLLSSSCHACVKGDESIMKKKAHGTSKTPVQHNLKWNVDRKMADRICNFNRHYAEPSGYWKRSSTFLSDVSEGMKKGGKTITFYDSNTGKPLFIAPKGRSFEDFVDESTNHGWPSFRDSEVVWENVRCLSNGETVSVDGTHLGHNLPDQKGSRYCINLISVAGHRTFVGDS